MDPRDTKYRILLTLHPITSESSCVFNCLIGGFVNQRDFVIEEYFMLPSVRTPSFFHVFPYLLVIFSGNAFSNDQNFIVTDSIVISVPEFSSGITLG